MSSPRIRRLQLDYQRLQERFEAWEPIQILEANGNPPESYRIRYAVRGLTVGPGGEIHERNEHIIGINLTLDYPRRAPQCKILAPVFHPNFDANTICIGDFWAASEGLDDLIIRIGRMIAYQEYNTKSPLNGLAAKWAAENGHLLPVDARELAPPLERESENLAPISISKDQTGDPLAAASGEDTYVHFIGHTNGPPEIVLPPKQNTDSVLPENAVTPAASSEQQIKPEESAVGEESGLVKLGAELSLIHLRVRCEGCSFEFGIPLSAVQSPVVCPHCQKEHKLANSFKCHVMESAGLFWFTPE
jgi:ubiquitin-protein ligase